MDKIKKYAFVFLVVLVSFFLGVMTDHFLFSGGVKDRCNALLKEMKSGTPVVVDSKDQKIIGHTFLNKVEDYYTVSTTTQKDQLISKSIDDYVILTEFKRSGLYKSKRFQLYMNEFFKKAVSDYYLNFLIEIKKESTGIFDGTNIEKIYQQNKSLFSENNIEQKQAYELIKLMLKSEQDKKLKVDNAVLRKVELIRLRKKYNLRIKE